MCSKSSTVKKALDCQYIPQTYLIVLTEGRKMNLPLKECHPLDFYFLWMYEARKSRMVGSDRHLKEI